MFQNKFGEKVYLPHIPFRPEPLARALAKHRPVWVERINYRLVWIKRVVEQQKACGAGLRPAFGTPLEIATRLA